MTEEQSLKRRLSKSVPVRAFGRALSWVGSGARTAVKKPIKAAQRKRLQREGGESGASEVVVSESSAASPESALQALTSECRGAVQLTQQRLSTQLQDSADFLRQRLPFAQQSTSSFFSANCFPPKLVTRSGQNSLAGDDAQDLISVGSRELLRFKLYDFAVYLDRKQARQSNLVRRFGKKARREIEIGGSELALTHGIRDSGDIEMCLMVRAARNLPIRLLAKEYERILRRRLRAVGGSPNDPALRTMMQQFREDMLPEEIKQGASVRKGTVLTFSRDGTGSIIARANGADLVSVKSHKLAQAVFDIYLGDQVVSTKARRDAGLSFAKMVGDAEYAPPRDSLICSEQACRVGKLC